MRVPLSLVVQLSQRLDEELQDIARQLIQAKEGTGPVPLDSPWAGRLSRMDAPQQLSMATSQVHRVLIRQRRVQAAKSRLLSDTYGECSACEKPIELNRLIADPAAPFCSECEAYIEAQP